MSTVKTVRELAALVQGEVVGDAAVQVTGVSSLEDAKAGQLSFYGNQRYKHALTATRASVILVPGQVESDASIAYGAPGERSNMGLLRTVRAAHPDAYVVYKPHPDVLARLRIDGEGEADAACWCDEVVADANMGDLLQAVDEVHVLTSLAGFEALLRGKAVTCHGQPFYSGWGLTHDRVPNVRRRRHLSIDELVAGALFAYPLYLSRDGRRLTTPEDALDTLLSWRQRSGGRKPWWQEIYRFFLRRIIGVR